MPVNIPQGGFSPEQQAMIDQRFGAGSQYGSGTSPGMFGTGGLFPARAAPASPGLSANIGAGGAGLQGGKPGGPGGQGQMSPQQQGGKPGGPGGQMGPQQRGKPGGPGGQMFNQAPQSGFPPPTGKPGMPPVNPQGLAGQRQQMGSGLLNLQEQQGVLDQANVNLNPAPQQSNFIPGFGTYGRGNMPY